MDKSDRGDAESTREGEKKGSRERVKKETQPVILIFCFILDVYSSLAAREISGKNSLICLQSLELIP